MRKSDAADLHWDRPLDRTFCENDSWFVRTREGQRGPFSQRRIAEAEAQVFVETMEYLERGSAPPANVSRDDATVVRIDQLPSR